MVDSTRDRPDVGRAQLPLVLSTVQFFSYQVRTNPQAHHSWLQALVLKTKMETGSSRSLPRKGHTHLQRVGRGEDSADHLQLLCAHELRSSCQVLGWQCSHHVPQSASTPGFHTDLSKPLVMHSDHIRNMFPVKNTLAKAKASQRNSLVPGIPSPSELHLCSSQDLFPTTGFHPHSPGCPCTPRSSPVAQQQHTVTAGRAQALHRVCEAAQLRPFRLVLLDVAWPAWSCLSTYSADHGASTALFLTLEGYNYGFTQSQHKDVFLHRRRF